MSRRTLTLLIVEDDHGMRSLIKRAASRAGMNVVDVSTLAEARAAIAATWFDLMVVDYHLPDGPGSQLAAEIKNALGAAAPPTLLITATPDEVPGEELDLFIDVLPKPFRLGALNDLIDAVRTLVRPARQRSGVELRRVGAAADDEPSEPSGTSGTGSG